MDYYRQEIDSKTLRQEEQQEDGQAIKMKLTAMKRYIGKSDIEKEDADRETLLDWQMLLDEKQDKALIEAEQFAGKSLRQLLKELLGAQKLIGRKGIIVPQKGDPETLWQAYYRKLGRPDRHEDYKLDFSDLSREDWYDEKMSCHMQQLMHHAGLNQEQARILAQGFKEYLLQDLEEEKLYESALSLSQQLHDLWQSEAEMRELAAERGAHLMGIDPDLMSCFIRKGDPVRVWQVLAEIGLAYNEDDSAGLFSEQKGMSPGDAKRELLRLNEDKDHVAAFMHSWHANHNQARSLRQKLVRLSQA